MPERNIELLEKVMRQITDHPEQHNQSLWWHTCGTPSCFFGWAEHFSGMTQGEYRDYDGDHLRTGARLLGLTFSEAYILSCSDNTRPMLALMVKDLVNGEQLDHPNVYRKRAHEHAP